MANRRACGLPLMMWLAGVGCGGEDIPPPPPTVLDLTFIDRVSGAVVEGAYARVGDAATWTEAADGRWRAEVSPGTYRVWVMAPGHLSVPRPFGVGPEVEAILEETVEVRIALDPTGTAPGPGVIRGTVTMEDGGPATADRVLVVAEGAVSAASRLDAAGGYVLLDLPLGPYRVRALGRGQTSSSADVEAAAEPASADLTLQAGGGAPVSGAVAGPDGATGCLDLVHAGSQIEVPGASVEVRAGSPYTIEGVPEGRYLVRLGLTPGDGWVADPNLTRRGAQRIDVTTSPLRDVDVGLAPAMDLIAPTDTSSTTATPILSWATYPGADFYVVDVRDAAGRSVWGGFDATGNWRFRILPPRSELTYEGPALVAGARYRWRILAADQDDVIPSSFQLLAGSEELSGEFLVAP